MGNIVLSESADLQSTPDRNALDIESEVQIFQAAVIAAKNELHAGKERMRASLTDWKVSGKNSAAEILGLDRSTLRARMRKLNIRKP
jgi:transcriptional regulator with GAF, ATPase, and Fis domain